MNRYITGNDLLNWTEYSRAESSEFVHIWSHIKTWLSVDICIDDDESYIVRNHPLWIYFRNGYAEDCTKWLPLCVSDVPYIPLEHYDLRISERDYNSVRQFVKTHGQLIKSLADGKINFTVFCNAVNNSQKRQDSLIAPLSYEKMVTIGCIECKDKRYKVAVHGVTGNEIPLLHLYCYDDDITNPVFDFAVSIIDILTKDKITLLHQVDQDVKLCYNGAEECRWNGYEDLRDALKVFLHTKTSSRLRGEAFIDNLDRVIDGWNRETDFNGYENFGNNPLKEYIDRHQLTVLPQYQKYF